MKNEFIKSAMLICASVVVSFFIVEIATRVFIGHPLETSNANLRIMLFEAGNNFKNFNNIFKYHENKEIISSTYYVVDEKPVLEFKYKIKTNNLGLVQSNDIESCDNCELILGDSFTEGLGYEPWFNDIENYYSETGRRFVNGGILGTGPLHWEILARHLQDDFSISFERVNVIFIGADIVRNLWNFGDAQVECLQSAVCPPGRSGLGDFHGYDFNGKDDAAIIEDVSRIYANTKIIHSIGLHREIVMRSAFLYNLYLVIKNHMAGSSASIDSLSFKSLEDRNLETIDRLTRSGKKPGFAMLVNAKHEAGKSDKPEWDINSAYSIKWFAQRGYDLHTCELSQEEFRKYDMHPNKNGYNKIKNCVLSLLERQKQ
ncbi:MAG: hypothetical protein HC900_03350 [Methylacidiphilales bacterium]|nr:hypothetical protein [Candidatus Methylacidiphilales bacterium]